MLTKEDRIYFERKILEYFEQEYEWAISALDRRIGEPWEIVHNAHQRMLGCCNLMQRCGMDYDYIEKLYNDYSERIEKISLDRLDRV
jgi:hypothetical protein